MTQDEAIKIVLDLARSELGYHEKASNYQLNDKTANSGSANWTKYAEYLDSYAGFYNGPKNSYAWCDVFCDYLFVKSFGVDIGRRMLCRPMNSGGAGCLYSAQYYKENGRWFTSPQPGDQIFFTYSAGEVSHTGIVEAVTGNTVTTIEGNTSDCVARRAYTMSNSAIYGYGRPRWELASEAKPSPAEPNAQETVPGNTNNAKVYGILIRGSRGDAVRDMQEKLISLGYDLGKYGADGDFGYDTLSAVKQFQKDHGLERDGEAGPDTLSALDKAVSEKEQKQSQPQKQDEKKVSSTQPTIKPTTQEKKPVVVVKTSSAVTKKEEKKFNLGDIVIFTGNKHFLFANAKVGVACRPGKAKITAINNLGKSKHPYHLVRVAGGGSNVFGWVNEEDIKAV